MKFLIILWQWFSSKHPDPNVKDTKTAVTKLILIDNMVVLLLAFGLGMWFAIHNPEIAEQLIDWLSSLL